MKLAFPYDYSPKVRAKGKKSRSVQVLRRETVKERFDLMTEFTKDRFELLYCSTEKRKERCESHSSEVRKERRGVVRPLKLGGSNPPVPLSWFSCFF